MCRSSRRRIRQPLCKSCISNLCRQLVCQRMSASYVSAFCLTHRVLCILAVACALDRLQSLVLVHFRFFPLSPYPVHICCFRNHVCEGVFSCRAVCELEKVSLRHPVKRVFQHVLGSRVARDCHLSIRAYLADKYFCSSFAAFACWR